MLCFNEAFGQKKAVLKKISVGDSLKADSTAKKRRVKIITQEVNGEKDDDTIRVAGEKVLRNLEQFTKKPGWFPKLIGRLVSFRDRPNNDNNLSATQYSFSKYVPFKGKVIRRITIYSLDPFGPTVDTPDSLPDNYAEALGNRLHVTSRAWTIRNYLLFKEGQRLVPFRVSESERLLRQSGFIYDAKIRTKRIKKVRDSIDLIVITQDLWSITPEGSGDVFSGSGDLKVTDNNFGGLGIRANTGVKTSLTDRKKADWVIGLQARNLYNSFIDASAFRIGDFNSNTSGIGANRDFFSPLLHYAGGANFEATRKSFGLLVPNANTPTGDTAVQGIVSYRQSDIWAGYAFSIGKVDEEKSKEYNYSVSGRVVNTVYTDVVANDSNKLLVSNTLVIGALTYSRRNFYKDNNIFRIGITEDVPTGNILQLLAGREFRDGGSTPYYGIRVGYSEYNNQIGYLYGSIQMGANFDKTKQFNNILSFSGLYFTPLMAVGRWRARHFGWGRFETSTSAILGYNSLSLNGSEGIRGFRPNNLTGFQKTVINYEVDLYPPVTWIGFRMAFLFFLDAGMLGNANKALFTGKFYSGTGVGVRFRNEQLVFPTVQITIGIYPNASAEGMGLFGVSSRTDSYYKFSQFYTGRPGKVVTQ